MSGRLRGRAAKALAVSLAVFFLLSVMLVSSRPAAAVSGTLQVVQAGLKEPDAFVFARDGRVFFGERPTGKIWIIENGSLLPDPFYSFQRVSDYHDQGLLGLALDPSFPSTPWVYAFYTLNDSANGTIYDRIVRIQATGDTGGSVEILLDRIPTGEWHIGGPIKFGPDGKLWALTGDAYHPANAQNLSTLAGKVLRLNPDGSVPTDNPFVGNASANPYIYTYGHRNLFGIAFHPITGKAYVTENGPECNDEVNLLVPGRNYGWGANYTCAHPPPDPLNTNRDGPDPVLPLIWYTPPIAPTNAIFYDGPSFAAWHGDFFFGTWNSRNVHRLQFAPPDYTTVLSDDVIVTLPSSEPYGVIGLEQGLDGAIWLGSTTTIYRFYDTSLPPIASFTTSSSTPLPGDLVTFNGSSSYDPDGSIATYAWDFGDGSTASGSVATHIYSTHGVYQATLVVTDFDNLTGSQTASIRVLALPSASFAFGPPRPFERASVTFDASNSTDPDGSITNYAWDWGDGSNRTVSVSSIAQHTFGTFGGYTVGLTVTDSDGLTNTTSADVHVFAAPFASFTISPPSPRAGQSVTLNGSASSDADGTIARYEWDFGDGATGSGPIAEHAFSAGGSYLIVLTVTDSHGFTATMTITLPVAATSPPEASFAEDSSLVSPGVDVTFNASGSSDSDGTILGYSWDFGDGAVGTGMATVHAYADSGSYTVTLTVLDDDQMTNSTSQVIVVNAPPVASFSTTPGMAYPGVYIAFNATGSSDRENGIVSYAWDFGDGTTAEGIVALHAFAAHGSFAVRLIVTDALGLYNETTKTIQVGNRGPVIESTSPQPAVIVNASESTTFQVGAFDPDGDALTYAWTVNGVSVAGTSPSYEFLRNETGTFLVKVVVSDGFSSANYEWVVEVRERATPAGPTGPFTSVALLGIAVGVPFVVLLLIVLMIRRRRSG